MSNQAQHRNQSIGQITGKAALVAIFCLATIPAAWASACLTGLAGTSSLAVALEPTVAATVAILVDGSMWAWGCDRKSITASPVPLSLDGGVNSRIEYFLRHVA